MSDRRFLVLHLPQLATDRIRQKEPELVGDAHRDLGHAGQPPLAHGVDAPGTTLHVGQALADAQAMHPELVLRPADPDGGPAFLERLALWAMRFTPLAAVDPPDGLVLDVTGCTDLFGGEAALLARVSDSLQRGGVAAQAVHRRRCGCRRRIGARRASQPDRAAGDETAAVAPLPLGALRLSQDCLAGLNRLGLQRIGDVLRAAPRAADAPLRPALDGCARCG